MSKVLNSQLDHQKKSQKAAAKRQVLQNQYFVGLFLLPFGDLDRQKEGIGCSRLVPNSYPLKVVAGEAVDFCLSPGTL